MSEGTATQFEPTDGNDHVRTAEAINEILSNEAKFRYLVLALIAAGLWWQALDPISAFTAGLGFVVLVFVAEPVIGMFATKRWASTEATVLESEVLTRPQAMERADIDTVGSRDISGYIPLIRYEYVVDGTTYENARISPFDASVSRRRWVEALIDHYPKGKWVDIHYHPDDPSRSYLQSWTRASRVNVFLPIALFFLVLATLIAIGINTNAEAPVGLIPIVMGLPFALWGLSAFQQAIRSYRWPTTTGVVTGGNVKAVSGGEQGETHYTVEILYEYEIDGESYMSKRYSFGGRPSKESRSNAQAWLEDHYPVGSEVTVHYHPRTPDTTVLKTGGAWNAFVVFLAGLVFCGLGVYIMLQPDLAIPPMVAEWIERLLSDFLSTVR